MTFVDLAGSERGADSMFHDAEQRKQCAAINASLANLKVRSRARRALPVGELAPVCAPPTPSKSENMFTLNAASR